MSMTTSTVAHRAEAPVDRWARARVAGLLYVVIIVCGLFAELAVRGTIVERGDASATAQNLLESATLFRLGIAADVVMLVADVAIAVVLFRLLRPLGRTLATAAAAFRLTQAAVLGLNLLGMVRAMRLVEDAEHLTGLDDAQAHDLALLALDDHRYGYLLGLTFFGVATVITAQLLLRSSAPRAMAIVLGLGGLGYVADTLMHLLIAGYDGGASALVLAPALIGEVWFALWLLTSGRTLDRLGDPGTRNGATAATSTV